MADYRRLEAVTRDPPGLDLGDDGGVWAVGDAEVWPWLAAALLVWCGGVGGVLWLLGRAWG